MLFVKIILIIVFCALLFLLYRQVKRIYKTKNLEHTLKEVEELQKEGRYQDAIHLLERDMDKKFDETKFLALINIIIASGDYKKAIEFFENNAKKGYKTFNTEMMWAYTEFLLGSYEKSIEKYKKLLGEYPENDAVIKFNLASVYLEAEKNLQEAEKIYQELLSEDKLKQKYNLYLNLGYAQMKLKKYKEAIINEKIALEKFPKDDSFNSLFALAHYVIGVSNIQLGNTKEGKDELNIAKTYSKNKEFITKIDNILNHI